MQFPQLRSMRARMTVGFVLFMSLVVLAGTASLVTLLRYGAKTRAEARLDVAYVSAKALVEEYEMTHPESFPLMQLMHERQSEVASFGVAILVVDAKNQVLWQSQKDVPNWLHSDEPWRWRIIEVNQQKLVLGIPRRAVGLQLAERAWALIMLGLLVVLGTALGAWWVVGRTLSPIGALARQVQQASQEELQVRLASPSHDVEMEELVRTFNELLQHLSTEAAKSRRFYAIASHELRTPLQALSGHLELSLSRSRSNADYQRALQESQHQTQRLTLLVQALLQLYQIENKTLPQPISAEISSIIEDQLGILQELMKRRQLRMQRQVEPATIKAPPGHLDIMIRNVLENAVKYSRRGSVIKVHVHRDNAKVLLMVQNQCEPSEKPASNYDASGEVNSYGLGMTICQSIVDINHWQLQTLRQDGMMTVKVWLE